MKITAYSFTSVGLKRANNEDSYLSLADENKGIFVVADGMGGHFGGEIASAMLVNQIRETWHSCNGNLNGDTLLNPSAYDVLSALKKSIQETNGQLYNVYSKQGKLCGTTFALIAIIDGTMIFMNAGDTRIYSCYGLKTCVESVDHVYSVEEKLKDNASENIFYDDRVTSAIGVSENYKLDIKSRPIRNGKYLICSDGVYKYMTNMQLRTAMRCDNKHIKNYIEKKVTSHKAEDNYTYILIEISHC